MRARNLTLVIIKCALVLRDGFSSNEAVAHGAEVPDMTLIRVVSFKVYIIKIAPEGRKAVAACDESGLPPEEIIVAARLAGQRQTELPAHAFASMSCAGRTAGSCIAISSEALFFIRKSVSTYMTSMRERLCGPLLFRVKHKASSRLNLSTNVAC